MQQVGEWLAKLGLAEYTKFFVENRIDFSDLPRPNGPAPEGPRTAARGQIENAPRDQGVFWSGFVTDTT